MARATWWRTPAGVAYHGCRPPKGSVELVEPPSLGDEIVQGVKGLDPVGPGVPRIDLAADPSEVVEMPPGGDAAGEDDPDSDVDRQTVKPTRTRKGTQGAGS